MVWLYVMKNILPNFGQLCGLNFDIWFTGRLGKNSVKMGQKDNSWLKNRRNLEPSARKREGGALVRIFCIKNEGLFYGIINWFIHSAASGRNPNFSEGVLWVYFRLFVFLNEWFDIKTHLMTISLFLNKKIENWRFYEDFLSESKDCAASTNLIIVLPTPWKVDADLYFPRVSIFFLQKSF